MWKHLRPLNLPLVPPLLAPAPAGIVCGTMALRSDHFTVYVAFHFLLLASIKVTVVTPDGGGSAVASLLQPYDFLYYSGVRAYFGEEWGKAAELLEKSLLTKEALLRVRRRCHDNCEAAGREALWKLGELSHM